MAMSKGKAAKGLDDTYTSVWDALADRPEQAANLCARAGLMRQIAEVVKDSGWTQVDAATRCGITQPRINDLLRGRVSRFSIDALVNIATALGRTVHFELKVARGRRAGSHRVLDIPPTPPFDSRRKLKQSVTGQRDHCGSLWNSWNLGGRCASKSVHVEGATQTRNAAAGCVHAYALGQIEHRAVRPRRRGECGANRRPHLGLW